MKSLLFLFIALISLSTFATTSDQEDFSFNGQRSSHEFNLNTEKTHTEFRWERRAQTCYRRVYVGDRYVCQTRYRQVCRTTQRTCRSVCSGSGSNRTCRRVCSGGQRTCHSQPYRSCRYVPEYRNEPYTCYRDVKVPFEVFDYNVQANVTFDFSNSRNATRASEQFEANLSGDNFSLNLNASGKYIVFATKSQTQSREGDLVTMNINYRVKMVDFDKAAGAFEAGYQNFQINTESIKFFMDLDKSFEYKHFLDIKKRKFFRKPVTLVSRELNTSQITNDNGEFQIDFSKLGLDITKGRYKVYLETSLNINSDSVLNREILSKLKTQRSLKMKVKKSGKIKIRN
jgi:hypothetical protein